MSKFSNVEEEFIALSEKKIDLSAILMKYFSYWRWFIASVLLCLFIAIIYLYFAIPKYEVTTAILFKDDQKGGSSDIRIFEEMGVMTRRNNADNEVEILKKSLIAESVIKEQNMNVTYFQMEPLISILNKVIPGLPKRKTAILYGDELPVEVKIPEDKLAALGGNITFDLLVYPEGALIFNGEHDGNEYQISASSNDTIVKLPFCELMLTKGKAKPNANMWLRIQIQNPLSVADAFVNSMVIELTSKTSSVADVALTTSNTELGKDFLQAYFVAYNEHGIRDQLDLAERTSKIIDNHLSMLNNDLNMVEDQAQEFKQSQGLTNIGSQADLYNTQLASVREKKMDIESQYSIVSGLLDFVQQKSGHSQLIPANSGVQSSILNSQISTYNNLVLERNRLARIASGSNQSMIDLNSQLESTFSSVVSGLQNEKSNLEILQRDINSEYSRNYSKIRAIPQQERVFSDIVRQQNTKEELFLYLLQKKEERYMNMTVVAPNSKLVDNVRIAGVVWPNKRMILLIFFMVGLILPVVMIKLKELLRYQIYSKEELEEITTIPVLGEVPKLSQMQTIAVKENQNDYFNEMLRLVRANLLFVLDSKEKKVINMLSSISGEGKSFITVNLAMSLALLEKKVLIIELDIRRPKLAKVFGLGNSQGVTLFLSGYLDKKDLIKPSGVHENLSVITAGAIPPNPNELLAKPILDDLINQLREEFDYILIDTSPIGLVSDGFLLNRLADVNMFVARVGYTPRKFIKDAEEYYQQKKLKRMYFILNSVDLNAVEYRYGMNKKYGYGYLSVI